MYGINPEETNLQIKRFVQHMEDIAVKLDNGGKSFFDTMRNCWFSNNAVAFGEKYSSFLYKNTVDLVRTLASYIATSAKSACDEMIIANGGTPFPDDYSYSSVDGDFGTLNASNNGVVGMDSEKVNQAIEAYRNTINNAYQTLDDIPTDLSLFDPNERIVAVFKDKVRMVMGTMQRAAGDSFNSLKGYVDNENHIVTTAAQKSADSFGGLKAIGLHPGMK